MQSNDWNQAASQGGAPPPRSPPMSIFAAFLSHQPVTPWRQASAALTLLVQPLGPLEKLSYVGVAP